jgi:hypothetical protein
MDLDLRCFPLCYYVRGQFPLFDVETTPMHYIYTFLLFLTLPILYPNRLCSSHLSTVILDHIHFISPVHTTLLYDTNSDP